MLFKYFCYSMYFDCSIFVVIVYLEIQIQTNYKMKSNNNLGCSELISAAFKGGIVHLSNNLNT